MTVSDDRRANPRLKAPVRIFWSVIGEDYFQIDRLKDVSSSGALIVTESVMKIGAEIRFELLDDAGEKFASGLGRVVRIAEEGTGITFLALGVDPALLTALIVANHPSMAPPSLAPPSLAPPSAGKGPPPLPPRKGPPSLPPRPKGPPLLPRNDTAPPPVLEFLETEASEEDLLELEEDNDAVAPQIEPLNVPRSTIIIGIDLGTTNTCASYVVDGRPEIIPGRTGTNTIPSMITFDPDGSFHVGQRAADRQVLQPLRTVYGSKRLIGRTYRADIAAELQKHFAYPLGEAEGQRFGARIDDQVISMDTIAARVLEEVRSTAEAYLKVPVEAAVITVPAYFSEVQRDAVRRAAREAKLTVHRIVNEPTAAAVAYGHKQKKKARIAVWDFGGGTFDFSVVDVDNEQLEVVCTGGDNFVGGSDFDDMVASYLLGEFQRAEGLELDPDPRQIARLREASELAKRALSVQNEYLVDLPEFTREPKRALSVELTRDRFDELTKALIDRTVDVAKEVMASGKLTIKDVDDVLLVGGSTRVPAVQRAVAELFERRPSKRINPDEAVALGAALLADEIGKVPALLDILPMSVGRGVEGLVFEAIVPRNHRLPAEREITLAADMLGTVTMPLFQGESSDVSKNEYLCSATVEDLSLWDGGRVTLRLSFDEHCVMAVDARDSRTGNALPVTLDRSRPIDEILRELGKYQGPEPEITWKMPESGLGKVLGKLFKLFGR